MQPGRHSYLWRGTTVKWTTSWLWCLYCSHIILSWYWYNSVFFLKITNYLLPSELSFIHQMFCIYIRHLSVVTMFLSVYLLQVVPLHWSLSLVSHSTCWPKITNRAFHSLILTIAIMYTLETSKRWSMVGAVLTHLLCADNLVPLHVAIGRGVWCLGPGLGLPVPHWFRFNVVALLNLRSWTPVNTPIWKHGCHIAIVLIR